MLALIAGQGRLPVALADQLEQSGQKFAVFQLQGFAADNPGGRDITTFAIEQLGSFLADLVAQGFDEVCFAGAIRRPPIDPACIDAATEPLMGRIAQAIRSGDDAALRAVVSIFEEQGLSVRAAQQIMPKLLPPSGVLSLAKPGPHHEADVRRAGEVIQLCGGLDLGQACVVAKSQVLAVEALPGTDFMLDSLRRDHGGVADQLPMGGILFKNAKPDQDRRVDMPTIGVRTVEGVANAGLAGIVIGTGSVLVIGLSDVVQACDRLGLFLWVRDPE